LSVRECTSSGILGMSTLNREIKIETLNKTFKLQLTEDELKGIKTENLYEYYKKVKKYREIMNEN
jgi:hypothetical protein